MSKFFPPALVAAVLAIFAAGSLPAAAATPAEPTVSEAAMKPMTAAKEAADAKRFDDVVVEAGKVLAMPAKSAFDTFVAYQFLTMAHAQKNDVTKLLEAMQGQVDSGIPQGAERARILTDMTTIAYEAKNYAKTVESGSQLIKDGAANAGIYGLVGNSMYLQGKHADAAKLLGEHVADLTSRGQVPSQQVLQVLVSSQDKAGDQAGVHDTLERLVTHYPQADYWRLALQTAGRGMKLADRQVLQLYRLRTATQTLGSCGEIRDMAEILTRAGMFSEGQRVVETGIASKLCADKADQDALQKLLVAASSSALRAKAELKDLEAEARAASTGELDAVLGASLFGFGEYARSAEVLVRGIGKGGIKSLVDAQFVLGIAQFRAGDKAAAAKTFSGIKTDDLFDTRLARLWALQVR
jgi:hypothetical protein